VIRPTVLISAAAAFAAGALAIGTASGSSPATPSDAVERIAHGFATGDVSVCEQLTERARLAVVADAPPAADCPELVRLVGEQPWFLAALEGATIETTTQDAERAVVRLELADATVNWLRVVPVGGEWHLDGGPWDVRVS
jgi:hypothetical protein